MKKPDKTAVYWLWAGYGLSFSVFLVLVAGVYINEQPDYTVSMWLVFPLMGLAGGLGWTCLKVADNLRRRWDPRDVRPVDKNQAGGNVSYASCCVCGASFADPPPEAFGIVYRAYVSGGTYVDKVDHTVSTTEYTIEGQIRELVCNACVRARRRAVYKKYGPGLAVFALLVILFLPLFLVVAVTAALLLGYFAAIGSVLLYDVFQDRDLRDQLLKERKGGKFTRLEHERLNKM